MEHGELSVGRQCELLGIARSTYYYQPAVESDGELESHANDRRGIPPASVFGQSQNVGVAEIGGSRGESQTRSASDAFDGSGSDLSQAANFDSGEGTQDLPLFIAGI